MQHPAVQPISFYYSFKCSLVILQALSLSAKITKLLTQQKLQIAHATQLNSVGCSSVVVTYFSRLPLLPGTLSVSSTSGKSITQQWVTGISTLQ